MTFFQRIFKIFAVRIQCIALLPKKKELHKNPVQLAFIAPPDTIRQ